MENSVPSPTPPLPEIKVGTTNIPDFAELKGKIPKNLPIFKYKKFIVIAILLVFGAVSFFVLAKNKKTASDTSSQEEASQNQNDEVNFLTENLEKEPTPTEAENSPTPTPKGYKTTTKILLGMPKLDGHVTSSGTVKSDETRLSIGRSVTEVSRGFFSFDLTQIPTGINIESASLRIYQNKIEGTPYIASGELRVDHMNYSDSLDAEDYSIAALISNLTTISTSKRIGWKETDVTQAVRDDVLNARSTSQYRVHFSSESIGGDKKGDFAIFVTSDDKGSQDAPQLVIEYY